MTKIWNQVTNNEAKILHGSFYAEDIRPGEKIKIEINSINGSKYSEELSVWRISPLGIEFVSSKSFDDQIKIGSVLDVIIHYPKFLTEHSGLVVSLIHEQNQNKIIGMRWVASECVSTEEGDRRSTKRWSCGYGFLPTGVFSSPIRFNDFIHFKVIDISSKGMLVETSMRNKLLFPGLKISNVVINFPVIGSTSLRLEIKNSRTARRDGVEILLLGCEFLSPTKQVLNQIGQYLVQFGPYVDLRELESNNLTVGSLNQSVTFTSVKSESDYRKVLNLRRKAWVSTGKLSEEITDEYFCDESDARSRILVAFYKGKAIGSVRLVFTEQGGKLEHEALLKLPEHIPPVHELAEIGRAVVDPDFRGKDILYLLLKHAQIAALQAGRKFLMGNSEESLVPVYTRLGMRVIGEAFEIKKLNIKARLFIGDFHSAISGKVVAPIVWNIIYRDLIQYVTDVELLNFSWIDRLRIFFYRLFYPISKIIEQRMLSHPGRRPKSVRK